MTGSGSVPPPDESVRAQAACDECQALAGLEQVDVAGVVRVLCPLCRAMALDEGTRRNGEEDEG